MGIATCTVELSNIVVGDLPCNKRRGDFYLMIECASNPEMTTAVAEAKPSKVVHFPEVLTLRLRYSMHEQKVRITVKELHLVGSQDLCEVSLNAMSVIDWTSELEPKRFAMKPRDPTVYCETPPWIVLEFSSPRHDIRYLDTFADSHSTVRTASYTQGVLDSPGSYMDIGMEDFKHRYRLVDSTGHAVQEPMEQHLEKIRCRRACVNCVHHFISCACVLATVTWIAFRAYIGSCYSAFFALAVAAGWPEPPKFPISTLVRKRLLEHCRDAAGCFGGRDPCLPNATQVEAICWRQPKGQPRPIAFGEFAHALLGEETDGVPCFEGVCRAHRAIVPWETSITVGLLSILIWNCCCFRPCANRAIEHKRRKLQRERIRDDHRLLSSA